MKKALTLLPLSALVAVTAIGAAAATTGSDDSTRAVSTLPRHDDGHGRHDGRDDARDDDSGCDSAEDIAEKNCVAGAASSGTSRTVAVPGRRLIGTVGPGYRIKLATRTGAPARAVPAGTYTIVVRDLSDEHNFRLRGRGFDKATATGATGTTTWRVKLARGTYSYRCDPHATMMKGTLTVR